MEERKDQNRPSDERPALKYGNEIMEVINALGRIQSIDFYGHKDVWGDKVDRGLRSDKDDMPTGHNGKQQLDGFNFQIHGDILILKYETEATTKEVHQGGKGKYEQEIKGAMDDHINFIKREFKDITGKALSLSQLGEPTIEFKYMNVHRSWVEAACKYKVGNLKAVTNKEMDGEQVDDLRGNPGGKLEESFDMKSWFIKTREDRENILLGD